MSYTSVREGVVERFLGKAILAEMKMDLAAACQDEWAYHHWQQKYDAAMDTAEEAERQIMAQKGRE